MKNTPHLLDDPYLQPYAEAIRGRVARADWRAKELSRNAASLADFASAHEYYGLHKGRTRWTFREWAPHATSMWLVGDFSDWKINPKFEVRRIEGSDVWEAKIPLKEIRHGQYYRLEVRWEGGRGERLPAYARRVVQDDTTKLFSAQVWEPKNKYVWKNPDYKVPPKSPIIYECHVGMATEEERVGTYAEFRDLVLPRIKKAGYNTVQIMAIMEHPYYGSFGYHVSSFFAASSRFGTPEDLKSLIDTAHGMGLSVIMDIVHSHAVKNERDGLSRFDGTDYQYFHSGGRGNHSAWDSRCFDYGKTGVLHFLLSNCRYWLDEFHFDGYRFDGVTSMLYLHHGLGTDFTGYGQYFDWAVDEDAWTYLALANRVIHEVRPDAITIAEDVSGMPGCAAPLEEGGLGFDFRMAMGIPDYWFKLVKDIRDEDWSVGHLYYKLTDKRADERVVSYVESHDQALVGGKSLIFELIDAAMYTGMDRESGDLTVQRGVALHKMARLATFAASGGAYLNFMGNEFGHPEWIDFPREGNGWSYKHARRMWSLRDNGFLYYKCLGDFDETMVNTIADSGVLDRYAPVRLLDNIPDKILAFMRGDFIFVFNFNSQTSFTDYGVMVPPGSYKVVFTTDEKRFGGQDRISLDQEFFSESYVKGVNQIDQIKMYLPSRTALVLRRVRPGGAR